MLPLVAGISLDLFVVAVLITGHQVLSAALGALLFGVFDGASFAFPR
jgi:hypothetical protein